MEDSEKRCRKAIAMLLDSAVHDFEKDDDCIKAVDFAIGVLREQPNCETKEAMISARNIKNEDWRIKEWIA